MSGEEVRANATRAREKGERFGDAQGGRARARTRANATKDEERLTI